MIPYAYSGSVIAGMMDSWHIMERIAIIRIMAHTAIIATTTPSSATSCIRVDGFLLPQ
jgi:hypothetical protein